MIETITFANDLNFDERRCDLQHSLMPILKSSIAMQVTNRLPWMISLRRLLERGCWCSH